MIKRFQDCGMFFRVNFNAFKCCKTVARISFTFLSPEFDFDLWSSPADVVVKKVMSDDWLDDETKRHTLKNNRKLQRKLPEGHHNITSALPAVEVPHAGASYNPSLKDHQVNIFGLFTILRKRKLKNIFHRDRTISTAMLIAH